MTKECPPESNLTVNQLLEWQTMTEDRIVERVLKVVPESGWAWVIQVNDPKAMPRRIEVSESVQSMATGDLRKLTVDPFATVAVVEEDIPDKHRTIRDRSWQSIEPLTRLEGEGMFISEVRGPIIAKACKQLGMTRKTVYHNLRRFWQRGQVKNALLPDYGKCGARGEIRRALDKKRGRKNLKRLQLGLGEGVNIGPEERDRFEKGIKLLYASRDGMTKRETYQSILERAFHEGYKPGKGIGVPALPPADKLPTIGQFYYWLKRLTDPVYLSRQLLGKKRWNLTKRPILGDSSQMAFGPGSLYQVDSTKADINLVSALDRTKVIGRPVFYVLIDVFSRTIAGFSVTLENASYMAGMLALHNAAENKVEYCRSLGIDILPEEWPCEGLPETLLADRGEFVGFKADQLVNALNVQMSNTPPYRGDLKGAVERSFRNFNDMLFHALPGAVDKDHQRGDRDPRLDAILDIHQLRQLVVHTILAHNRMRMDSYRLQEAMIADHVDPIPNVLWEWGILNRTGHLKSMDANLLRLNLLPQAEATVTGKGIRFGGAFYTCETAEKEGWFSKARSHPRWKERIAFDPRKTDTIYLRHGDSRIEVCTLLSADERFLGRDWGEVHHFFEKQAENAELALSDALDINAELNASKAAILSEAAAMKPAASGETSNRGRLKNIRANRAVEREVDKEQQPLAPSLPVAELVKEDHGPREDDASSEDQYVPAPSRLEILRIAREKAMNNGTPSKE